MPNSGENNVKVYISSDKTARRIAVSAAALILLGIAVSLAFAAPRQLFDDCYSTTVYSSDGELLGARIAPDGQWRFRQDNTLPAKFVSCLTAFEDRRFFTHKGVDPVAIARAVVQNIEGGGVVSGGSTLTMQLARMARGDRPRTLWQKGVEALWAVQIERRHSKEEILAMYAAHAPFGSNVVGAETAAWRYFGRGLGELSWAESATLAVLPNSPALIHPGRNREALREKRDRLLANLTATGIIDHTEYELACMEPLPDAPMPLPGFAPHLTERMVTEMQGRRANTSINATLQRRAQQIVDNHARDNASNHIYNLAAVIADVETGEVLAYVGNVSFAGDDAHGNSVDIIASPRSTGSILKPLLYAGMLTDGMILPNTLIPDTPLSIGGFTPHNSNRRFHGSVPARRAIERSLNVPLVRMLGQYNTGRFMELLKACGMTTLRFPESHYGASLILGGAEGTLWDMAGMYASMARTLNHFSNYNSRYDPGDIHPLRLIPGSAAKPIESPTDPRLRNKSPLSAASLWFTLDAMSGLNRPEEEADWQQFPSMKRVAWKTGTSYGGRDGWAIGVTPKYVVGVWAGNASGEGRAGLTGVAYAAPVLFELFSMLPGGEWFRMPYDELEDMPVCRRSGHKASEICDLVDTLPMPASGTGTQVCPYHRKVHLSPDGRWRVNSSCESVERMIIRPWFVLPPAQEYYYRTYNPDYRPLPPWKDGCTGTQTRSIDIIYPEHNAVLYLPVGFSGTHEKFIFRAAHAEPAASIHWHLDSDYIATTTSNHQVALEAPPGRHTLTLTDDRGNTRRINFSVK